MKRYARGFTLIEIAIVLVIIGLLLGGVLKGQELITGARVRNLISQQDGIKAAFFGFQDRYRALPGDYAAADTNINCGANPCAKGNGNGRIESASAPINGSLTHEETLVWSHLTSAGFLNGSYNFADTAATDANTPKNPYGSLLDLENDQQYGQGTGPLKHNLKTGAQIPWKSLQRSTARSTTDCPIAALSNSPRMLRPVGPHQWRAEHRAASIPPRLQTCGRSEAAAPTAARVPCSDAVIHADTSRNSLMPGQSLWCAAPCQGLSAA